MQKNKNMLAFLDDVYEDLELWYPKLRLEEAGYTMKCAARNLYEFLLSLLNFFRISLPFPAWNSRNLPSTSPC